MAEPTEPVKGFALELIEPLPSAGSIAAQMGLLAAKDVGRVVSAASRIPIWIVRQAILTALIVPTVILFFVSQKQHPRYTDEEDWAWARSNTLKYSIGLPFVLPYKWLISLHERANQKLLASTDTSKGA